VGNCYLKWDQKPINHGALLFIMTDELKECLLEWLKNNNPIHYNGVKERELIKMGSIG